MAVNVEQAGAVVLAVDDVVVKDLVVEGARCAHGFGSVDMNKGKAEGRAAGPSARRKRLDKSAGQRA
ncbi:hypothetical protein D3C80_2171800 [compost metagenome]